MTTTPIKRSKSLVPLSKDHHEGLLITWKIRQGQKNNISNKRIADFVLNAFDNHLQPHFIQEEELLFTNLSADNQMLIKAKEQHANLRKLAAEISIDKDDSGKQLELFANLLEEHIRFEERVLFQHIEQHVQPAKMEAIGAELEKIHLDHQPLNWEDEFWLRK